MAKTVKNILIKIGIYLDNTPEIEKYKGESLLEIRLFCLINRCLVRLDVS
jgi:hypothetical protein